jgi:hypothetical protein
MRRAGQSEEIVGAAMYLASDASTYTTGSIIVVDGGAQWSMAGTGDGAPDAGPATEDAGVATECAGGPSPGDPAAARLEVNSNPR